MANEADKLTTAAAQRIAKLMRLVVSPDITDNEWQNAFKLLMTALQEVDPGGHEITKRIEAPPISEEAMLKQLEDVAQQIFDAGAEHERAKSVAARQHTAPSASFFTGGSNSVGRPSIYSFDDTDRVGGMDRRLARRRFAD